MSTPDFQVQIQKNGNLIVVKPDDGSTLASVPFAGQLAKGCKGSLALAPLIAQSLGIGAPKLLNAFETLFSFGHFSSPTVPGVINMVQNPKLADSGYEVEETPGHEYPRIQHWRMYGIFTLDLSGLDPKLALFHAANRATDPIRLKCRMTAPWGTQSLLYELQDEQIPLYPWDPKAFDFSSTCPLTGGAPAPIGYIQRTGDRTEMVGAFTKVHGVLKRTL